MPMPYRPSRFEALTGEPIEATTRAGLQRLCEAGLAEADDLEFKQSFYAAKSPADNYEAAKDISAMANLRGGVIVIGIERSEPGGAAKNVVDLSLSDMDADRLHQVIADLVAASCEFEVRRVPESASDR